MFMWIGINVSMQWVQDVFGVQSAAQIDIDKTMLQDLDTPLSKRVRAIVKKIRDERRGHLKVSLRSMDRSDCVNYHLCFTTLYPIVTCILDTMS